LEAWRLGGYDGDDVEYILHLLQHPNPDVQSGLAAGERGTPNFTMIGDPGLPDGSGTLTSTEARSGTAWNGTSTSGSMNEESPNADLGHALHYASIGLLGLLVIEV